MRILAVSDEIEPMLYDRFDAKNFKGIDLIVSCGDLPSDYLSFLVTVFGVPLFYVRGNHDVHYDSRPPDGCFDLDGKILCHRGYYLFGLEGCRLYNNGPLQYTEMQMLKKMLMIRLRHLRKRDVDIFITHAPPRHVHDAEDICHRGFRCFHFLIRRYAPVYHLHGHVHKRFVDPKKRTTMVGRTRVVNTFGYAIITI